MPTYEELRDAAVARPAPQAGQYAIVQPEAEAAEKLPLRERLKDLAALTHERTLYAELSARRVPQAPG